MGTHVPGFSYLSGFLHQFLSATFEPPAAYRVKTVSNLLHDRISTKGQAGKKYHLKLHRRFHHWKKMNLK